MDLPEDKCVILIGMAGAGKSTIGRKLAQMLNWEFLDTDNFLEQIFGQSLQTIKNQLSKEQFIALEAQTVQKINLQKNVIATGGSVVYNPETISYLHNLGPLIYLRTPLSLIEQRIADNPKRGLTIAPGQSIADLFLERQALYEESADFIIECGELSHEVYVQRVYQALLKHWENSLRLFD